MAGFLFSMLSWLLWAAVLAVPALGQATFVKGEKWQIILTGTPDVSKMPLPPTDALVWDIDLFDNDVATVKALKAAGKAVICYFSAGTVEDWRDDAKQFPAADTGKVLPEWPNEKWIRISSTKVRSIMAARIKLAGDKGCDAIDPDNVDGYQNDNGLNLKSSDSVDYIKWMQTEAAKYNMKIGLKNALDIVDTVTPNVDFAVNEQCAQLSECEKYNKFLATNKPVFHIEYPNPLNTSAARTNLCTGPGTTGMSTILKTLALDGQTVYCDGSQVDTPTKGGTRPTTSRPPTPPKTSSAPRPTSTPRPPPVTTQRPTSTPARTSSAARPTSTSGGGGGGGCRSKHWDQCGGQNWNGCTVCESPYTCKGVSPPYYYQCL